MGLMTIFYCLTNIPSWQTFRSYTPYTFVKWHPIKGDLKSNLFTFISTTFCYRIVQAVVMVKMGHSPNFVRTLDILHTKYLLLHVSAFRPSSGTVHSLLAWLLLPYNGQCLHSIVRYFMLGCNAPYIDILVKVLNIKTLKCNITLLNCSEVT
jgi:ABC-type cobalt transport system substrate-binding protein